MLTLQSKKKARNRGTGTGAEKGRAEKARAGTLREAEGRAKTVGSERKTGCS